MGTNPIVVVWFIKPVCESSRIVLDKSSPYHRIEISLYGGTKIILNFGHLNLFRISIFEFRIYCTLFMERSPGNARWRTVAVLKANN
jgi:hypothetical protein